VSQYFIFVCCVQLAADKGIMPVCVRHRDSSLLFSMPYQPPASHAPTAPVQQDIEMKVLQFKAAGVNTAACDLQQDCPRPPKRKADDTLVVYEPTIPPRSDSCPQPKGQPSVDEMLSMDQAMEDQQAASEILRELDMGDKNNVNRESPACGASRLSGGEHNMVPGAASGANVIAIEIPECASEAVSDRQAGDR
jgi:hypothetical protein